MVENELRNWPGFIRFLGLFQCAAPLARGVRYHEADIEGTEVTWRAAPSQKEQMYGEYVIDATLIPCIELEPGAASLLIFLASPLTGWEMISDGTI